MGSSERNVANGYNDTATDDGIAIIGMALRFADDVSSPQELWEYFKQKRSAMSPFPSSRWNPKAHSGLNAPNMMPQKGAHFMTGDLASFDGSFFSISPHEIASMDPQQRMSLECSYQAFENAGLTLSEIAGTATSVFSGVSNRDYELQMARDPDVVEKYRSTGVSIALVANRLSWFYDLRGPSIALDTACSTSLSAVHLACQSIRSNESSMSLVGGANFILQVDNMLALHSLGMLSHNSISRSFDADADGFARGEGCGFLVLKRLSDAIRDGNTIRAIIRASCANQDGHTPSIVQPNQQAQAELIRRAYKNLDIHPTRYFEAHGTGTRLGDSIEAEAINSVFKPTAERPLFIGAAKSNFGHLEAASGILSMIKTILVLEHGIIPPNVFFNSASPLILAMRSHLHFPTTSIPWPNEGIRRASINSFGYGGANVHLVLDDARSYLESRSIEGFHNTIAIPLSQAPAVNATSINGAATTDDHDDRGPQLLVWSAADKSGVDRYITKLSKHLGENPLSTICENPIADLAYTLSEKRSHLAWRSFALVKDAAYLVPSLNLQRLSVVKAIPNPNLAFIFTGQGANWATMGAQLKVFPVFEKSLQQAQSHFHKLGATWALIEELDRSKEHSKLDLPEYSQPVCTAIQMALVDLLHDWQVLPRVVIGHSSGEIAAAYCTGAISQASAWTIAYSRGAAVRPLTKLPNGGGMISVGLSEEKVDEYIKKVCNLDLAIPPEEKLTTACVNSYNSVTISGSVKYLDGLGEALQKDAVFFRRLPVNVAYHSQAMRHVSELYTEMLGTIKAGAWKQTSSMMISTVTGNPITSAELQKPSYWVSNLVSPVLFKQAVSHLRLETDTRAHHKDESDGSKSSQSVDFVIEVGPHSALKGPLRNIFGVTSPGVEFLYTSLLTRDLNGLASILTAAGLMFQVGVKLNIHRVNSTRIKLPKKGFRMLIDLPSYVFDHTRQYWAEGRRSKNYRFRSFPPHELLGHQTLEWNPSAARWQNFISMTSHPWVEHHKIAGAYIYPAAGILVMAIEAARQLNTGRRVRGFRFIDAFFVKALVIPENGAVETELSLEKQADQNDPASVWYKFKLFVHENAVTVNEMCYGELSVEFYDKTNDGKVRTVSKHLLEPIISQSHWKPVSSTVFYNLCSDHGLHYGTSFRGLDDIRINSQDCATATVDLDHWRGSIDGTKYQSHVIHPAALDAMIQLTFAALNQMQPGFSPAVPTHFRNLWISSLGFNGEDDAVSLEAKPPKFEIYCRSLYTGFRNASTEIIVINPMNSNPILECHGSCTALDGSGPSNLPDHPMPLCYSLEWKPDLEIASSSDVYKYCSTDAAPRIMESNSDYGQILALCYFSAQRALQKVNGLDLTEQNSKYLEFLKQCLQKIDEELGVDQRIHFLPENDNDEVFSNLCNTVESISPDGRLVARTSRNMEHLLLDEVNVVELFFSDDMMYSHYQYTIDVDSGFCQFGKWLDAYVHKYPSCKFLEVGAGTGATTKRVLDIISKSCKERFEEYTFTDISSGFFDKAKDSLATYSDNIQYAVLDIEKDPAEQGHKVAYYDIIIATNVLHATKDIRETLRNVRSLMRPGGKLIITEFINAAGIFPGFSVGFFPGWWQFKESERTLSPLMSEAQWTSALLDAGFSSLDLIFRGHRNGKHSTSTMTATVQQTEIPNFPDSIDSGSLPPVWIVVEPQSARQTRIALQLQSKLGPECQIMGIDDIPQVSEIQQCIFLPSLENDVLQSTTKSGFLSLSSLLSRSRHFLWVYSAHLLTALGPVNQAIVGFARSAMTEYPDNNIKLLGFDRNIESLDDSIEEIGKNVLCIATQNSRSEFNDHQMSYIEVNGLLYIDRLQSMPQLDNFIVDRLNPRSPQSGELGSQCVRVRIGTPGSLDTLRLVSDTVHEEIVGEEEVLISVKAIGVNFRDLLMALGKIQDTAFGGECAGVVISAGSRSPFMIGDRVSCLIRGSMGTHLRCHSRIAVPLPAWMTFVQGASWMTSFATAYYALVTKAQISEGERVLIHSGAGAMGQACIQIAQLYRSDVYTTVGNSEKIKFLMEQYGIPRSHIFNSRSSEFEHEILAATGNQGVDIIVNSLSGELLKASWRCIAPFGRFIETGKRDILTGNSLPLSMFEKNVTFTAVDLSKMDVLKTDALNKILRKIVNLFNGGAIRTLNIATYPLSKVEQALRDFQTGNTTGKIVLEVSEKDNVMVVPPMRLSWHFPAEATYIIAGGLGGIGRSLARWMSGRGATHIVLLGRKGGSSTAAKELIAELEKKGTKVVAIRCDITIASELKSLLKEIANLPPVKGCIQAAMVLEDVPLKSMSFDDYKRAAAPKIQGTWNLHEQLPSGMDFFIMLSSISGVVGTHGQANYASANTYLDGIARYRRLLGENAVSLDIGKILSVGYVAESENTVGGFMLDLFPGISENKIYALLEFYCRPSKTDDDLRSRYQNPQVVMGIDSPDLIRARGISESPWYMEQALFRQLRQVKAHGTATSQNEKNSTTDINSLLGGVTTLKAATDLIVQGLATKLERALGVAAGDLDDSNALKKYGIDSLSAVELRTWLRTVVGADITVFELLSDQPIRQLANHVASISSLVPVAVRQVDGVAG